MAWQKTVRMNMTEVPAQSVFARSLSAALLLFATATTAPAQFYAVTDLGTLGGTNGMAYGINSHEQIVGTMQTAGGNYHAFMFDSGRLIDLGTLGGSNSWCYGVNDAGWMVGGANLPGTNIHAFLCTNALVNPMLIDLGTLGGTNSFGCMIAPHGDMVGWSSLADGSHHAFFMTNFFTGMMDLGTQGGTNSEAYCINSNLMVVGYALMTNGTMEPIMTTNALYGSSSMMSMSMGGLGAMGGQSWFINNLGDDVGEAQMAVGNVHAYLSGAGGMMGRMTVDLGTLGGSNSFAYCINDYRSVVGTAQMTNGSYHAFLLTNALGGMVRMMDLNNLIPTNSGWELMMARQMNTTGQIVGWGMHSGRTNAFLLTPVSQPVMMLVGPASQIVASGSTLKLQLTMMAGEPLTYQWLHDGVAVARATNAALTLPSMDMGIAGRYTVLARNAVGTVGSASAVVGMFSVSVTTDIPHLKVAAPSGSHFRIDYSEMLGAGAAWRAMTNFTVTGGVGTATDAPPSASPVRFYRAAMLP